MGDETLPWFPGIIQSIRKTNEAASLAAMFSINNSNIHNNMSRGTLIINTRVGVTPPRRPLTGGSRRSP